MSIMHTLVRGELAARDAAAVVRQRLSADSGASAVEYALLVGLIAVVIIGAVRVLGQNVSTKLNNAATALT